MSESYDKGYITVTMLLLYASFASCAFESYEITLVQERSTEQVEIIWATFYNLVTAQ